MEDPKTLFVAVGLDPKKADETLKNKKLSEAFVRVIKKVFIFHFPFFFLFPFHFILSPFDLQGLPLISIDRLFWFNF